MPETRSIPGSNTQHVGVFNLRNLQVLIRQKLAEEEYFVIEPGYEHKVGGEGADLVIEVVGDKKVNAYARFKITAKIKTSEMTDVEVTRNDKKVKMQHGRLHIAISGEVELDYAKKFEKNAFMKGLRDFYHKFIINRVIDNVYWDAVHTTIFKLQRAIRDELNFEAR
ncbi:hypothetical protein HY492_03875 [Candidatus Woesearchaeota archaeon]|nr:hypothetical protein [Candidatus Woesearchaeota archaeon]